MVNGFRYYRALESVSIASALSARLPLLPFTHARSESIDDDSLNSNFLQLGRRSGGRPQRAVHPMRLPVNTVIHTTLVGLEPATFRSLVRHATSSATEPCEPALKLHIRYSWKPFKHRIAYRLAQIKHHFTFLPVKLTVVTPYLVIMVLTLC